jgi:hypothetical protein
MAPGKGSLLHRVLAGKSTSPEQSPVTTLALEVALETCGYRAMLLGLHAVEQAVAIHSRFRASTAPRCFMHIPFPPDVLRIVNSKTILQTKLRTQIKSTAYVATNLRIEGLEKLFNSPPCDEEGAWTI